MSRTTIVAQSLLGSYPTLPIDSGGADLIFTATDDPTDRETTIVENKTLVLGYNTDSGAHTVTFTSVVDSPYNRTGDIAAYSVAAGKVAAFGPFKSAGWSHTGKLYIDVSDPTLRLAVITLP